MLIERQTPKRYIGLDVHKHYLIAVATDTNGNLVYGPQRVQLSNLEHWTQKTLTFDDAVVLEMTTNTWQLYDELMPHAHSVTVVHPPHVALITRAQVMTDKIAAFTLARLHAKGLLVGIWVPSDLVRDQRALVAQRSKMIRLSTQAKNRLHAMLHRHHIPLPEDFSFASEQRSWWLGLPVSKMEQVRIRSDLDTLAFAQQQIATLEQCMTKIAAQDGRVPLLVQLTGVSVIIAQTILAAIGDISRFPNAKKLVGYAGLGARIHDSGQTTRTGRITKAGRRDLRAALVEMAQTAVLHDPHWKAELERLEPHLGRNKAIVAIARKLLVVVWHILTEQVADRFAEPERVARKFLQHAYRLGPNNRPDGQTPLAYTRQQLDRLGIGANLDQIAWGPKRKLQLPPSGLSASNG